MSDSDKERLLGQPWDNEDFESTTPILDKRKRRGLNVWVVFSTVIAIVVSLLSIIDLQRKSQRPFATPEEPPREVCEHSTARPSWHELPLHRRRGYVHAVQRLSTLPSRLGLNTSLYDDFTYVHTQLVWQVHHVAMSLPFHRYFLYLFEQTLQLQGGYDGPIPYWDWTLDAGNPLSSPMWDPVAAFGGNGSGPDNCVEAGVFNRIGKVSNYTEDGFRPHCVARVFNSTPEDGVMHSVHWKDDVVQKILRTSNTYAELREKIENGPHRHVHRGIGGEMPKPSSTNDPVFFLHHAQIDRLWWLWQQKNPLARLDDFSGPVQRAGGDIVSTGAKLSDMIEVLGLAADVPISRVMTTNNNLLCYKYKIKT